MPWRIGSTPMNRLYHLSRFSGPFMSPENAGLLIFRHGVITQFDHVTTPDCHELPFKQFYLFIIF